VIQQQFKKPKLRMELKPQSTGTTLVLVSNLPDVEGFNEEDLVAMGQQAGNCVAAMIMDSTSAVLEFSSPAEAKVARDDLDGSSLPDGSSLVAREFHQEELEESSTPPAPLGTMVWIGNLPDANDIPEDELMYMGTQAGDCVAVGVLDAHSVVFTFSNATEAAAAVDLLNGAEMADGIVLEAGLFQEGS